MNWKKWLTRFLILLPALVAVLITIAWYMGVRFSNSVGDLPFLLFVVGVFYFLVFRRNSKGG